jgi:carbamoylphosphate synthase large subunit
VEAPDALYPFDGSETIFRYSENYFSAGIGYKKDYGVIVLGFPFETILKDSDRDRLMNLMLKYFEL